MFRVQNNNDPVFAAQIKGKYGDTQGQILKATLRREATLIQRNSFIYIFRAVQVCPLLHRDEVSTGVDCDFKCRCSCAVSFVRRRYNQPCAVLRSASMPS